MESLFYVLDYLAGKYGFPSSANAVVSEYRLLCSGELYNGRVKRLDSWRKYDVTRHLLWQPFSLRVVSQPFQNFPQELSLRITSPEVTETSGNFSLSLRADDDIAEDLAVLLTLLLRRLVTVYTKIQTIHPTDPAGNTTGVILGADSFPFPVFNSTTMAAWKEKPTYIEWHQDVKSVDDYNPRPLPVDPAVLQSKLTKVAELQYGETFVLAARLYAQAMRVIEESPNIAYQLLVYSAETIANKVLADYCPSREEMIKEKAGVAHRAKDLGVSDKDAQELAVLACAGIPWASRKFRIFLKEIVSWLSGKWRGGVLG